MIRTEPEIDLNTLGTVTVPTLVLQGDQDEVTLQHSAEVVAALPDARLAVLPGSHGLPLEIPQLVNPLLVWFLGGGPGTSPWNAPSAEQP
jgi:pimeloyl-ACP methyl ester carboxylesterase